LIEIYNTHTLCIDYAQIMNAKKLQYRINVTVDSACHRDLQKLSIRESRSMASEVKFLVDLRTKMLEADAKMSYTLLPTFNQQPQRQQEVKIAKEIVAS
jgi:hypothetical protein